MYHLRVKKLKHQIHNAMTATLDAALPKTMKPFIDVDEESLEKKRCASSEKKRNEVILLSANQFRAVVFPCLAYPCLLQCLARSVHICAAGYPAGPLV